MFLFIGLGNPEEKYKETRHNIGRELLQEWQKKENFAGFEFDKKLDALVSKNKNAVLLLPETYVNKSGNAVAPAVRIYKIKPKDVIVVHDDADIELGRAKLTYNRSSAGHKGVDSARRALKTEAFWRLRIGIQKKKRVEAMKLVLQKFSPVEQAALKKLRKKIFSGLKLILEKGPEIAMNEVNRN
ncbi:MAG: aminoacyl-tRNA hydrolase [Candidatus Colwellbacteria bacterium]|nr:aminoacyl-tRNA hydrolase [Candidatus Colwellbacteria bacterium]